LLWQEASHDEEELEKPPSFLPSRAAQYEKAPEALVEHLRSLSKEQRQHFAAGWGNVDKPVPLLELLFERMPEMRKSISRVLASYFHGVLNIESIIESVFAFDDAIHDMLESPEYVRIRARQLQEFKRCAAAMAPYSSSWVMTASEVLESDTAAVREIASKTLGDDPDAGRMLEVVRNLDLGGRFDIAGEVLNAWIGRHVNDPERLAEALVRMDTMGGRAVRHFGTLAKAFWKALAKHPEASSETIQDARRVARLFEPRPRKPRAKPARQTKAKKPAKPASGTKRGPGRPRKEEKP
jgi:hypothetical protein